MTALNGPIMDLKTIRFVIGRSMVIPMKPRIGRYGLVAGVDLCHIKTILGNFIE